MQDIVIPVPNIPLSSIIKRRAKDAIDIHLTRRDLSDMAHQLAEYRGRLISEVEEEYYTITNPKDRLLFISELLIHLNGVYTLVQSQTEPGGNDDDCLRTIEDLQLHLHSEIVDLGFNIDENQFTTEEVSDLAAVVDQILAKLDELRGGQDVIFERIEELKSDFEDVLTTTALGKKTTKQRMLGIVGGYFAEKGADAVYAAVLPIVMEALKHQNLIA